MKALILAGGFGKRLRPLTESIPKPLVKINDKPILEYIVSNLKRAGVDTFVITLGYLGNKIIEEIGSGKSLGIKVAYVVEESPLGTAGAIRNAKQVFEGEDLFIVTNGDIITNIDVSKMISLMKERKELIGCIALVRMKSPYGIIEEENGVVKEFLEKPLLDHWINAGIYVFRREIFDYLPEKGSIETEVFPVLAKERKLCCVKFENCYWKSIDTLKDFEEASREISKIKII